MTKPARKQVADMSVQEIKAKLKEFPSGDFDEEVARLIRCLQLPDFEADGFIKACTDAANMLESLEWGNVDLRQGLATAESSLETARWALEKLEKAVCTMLAQKTDTMHNGNGIEMDDGEKGYIVHSDDIYALEMAVAKESDE